MTDIADLKRRSLRGLAWTTLESFGVVAFSFAAFLLLARLLAPQDFGLAAMASVAALVANLLASLGFAEALIRSRTLRGEHLHAAFWGSLVLSLVLAATVWAGAESLGRWLGEPDLAPLLKALALTLPVNALGTVPTALLRRNMAFRVIATWTLAGRLAGALGAAALALSGFGVWSLIGQQAIAVVVTALGLLALSTYRPRLSISLGALQELAGFGAKISVGQTAVTLGEQAMIFLVGALHGAVALGFYSIAARTVDLGRGVIQSAVYSVAFSAFSRLQDDPVELRRAFLNLASAGAVLGSALGLGGLALHEPLIIAVFGDRWMPSAPVFAALALLFLPSFFGFGVSALYRASGRANWTLYTSFLYVAVGAAGVWGAAQWGVVGAAIALAARPFLLMPLEVWLCSRILGGSQREIWAQALGPLVAGLVMGALVHVVDRELSGWLSPFLRCVVGAGIGACAYSLLLLLLAPGAVGRLRGIARRLGPAV